MSAAESEAAALFQSEDKLSRHPEDAALDSTDSEPSSDVDEHDENEPEPPSAANMPANKFHLPNTRFNANTGPKGVIADAHAFEQAKRRKSRFPGFNSLRGKAFEGSQTAIDASRSEKGSEDDSNEDDNEEEFMRNWRQNRLLEIRSGSQDPRTRRQSPSRRKYGTLDAVDAAGYLDAVEKVPASTIVVVCIYDDQSEVSQMVEDCLMNIARKYDTTRFVKLHYEEAEMDAVSVPALLAYKDGDLVANLVAIIDEIPEGRALSSGSLETVLKKHRVLF